MHLPGRLLFLSTLAFSFSTHAELYEGAANIQSRVNNFTGMSAYQSLLQLENNVPHEASSATAPWSGNYWPLYQGQIAFAYTGQAPKAKELPPYRAVYERRMNEVERKLRRNDGWLSIDDIEGLAPSEKYDLYLGDTSFTLTRAVWASLNEADGERDRKHKIKDWEGICHGWAAASAYSKRPVYRSVVRSVDGRFNIPFYPDDIKALSALLWANSLVQDQSIMEGMQCKEGYERDYGTGKVTTTRCKGVNPGVFHLVMLGMIGQKHVSFIINKNNDEEVWNQPVYKYKFSYYNVESGEEGSLQTVALPIAKVPDQFVKFRPAGVTQLVGVDMTVTYSNESDPSHQKVDDASHDELESMHIRYDLELDAAYDVLGGEWIDSDSVHEAGAGLTAYPGFMWKFKYDQPLAASIVESAIPEPGTPQFTSPVLIDLQKKAAAFRYNRYFVIEEDDFDRTVFDELGGAVLESKELRPQPLGKVVNHLVELSQVVPPPQDPDEEGMRSRIAAAERRAAEERRASDRRRVEENRRRPPEDRRAEERRRAESDRRRADDDRRRMEDRRREEERRVEERRNHESPRDRRIRERRERRANRHVPGGDDED